jgi:hypothetical protein
MLEETFEPVELEARKRQPGLACLLVSLGLALLAYLATPNYARAQGRYTANACPSNCKNLATALEMYASDHHGMYPGHLANLTAGNYLKVIPTCPAAGKDTYSISYQVASEPAAFSFACTGDNHSKSYVGYSRPGHNYPRYNSWTGLESHP